MLRILCFYMTEYDGFECLVEGLIKERYGVCNELFSPALIQGLRQNLYRYAAEGEMHPAGIGRRFDYQKNTEVRGDLVRWIDIDDGNPFEVELLQIIDRFIQHLNSTCYTSLNDYEFHYASYEPGSFYKRHLDQFKNEKGRKFSFVIYLNDGWDESEGGKLSLYLDEERIDSVYPVGGRIVFFKSDEMEHEVHPAPNRSRISIAGWLKNK